MAFDKVIDSAALDAGMTATANAIRKKTGGTTPIAWDSANGFKAAVEGIDTEGGVTLPTLTNPGAATDLAKGKQLIGADGLLIEGTVPAPISYGLYLADEVGKQGNDAVRFVFPISNLPIMFKNGFSLCARLTEFGDAAASDVAKGKTFTSAAGLQVEGTLEAGGSGFADGNLLFSEHIVTVEEGNGVTNHENLITYFQNQTGYACIFAYSLIGIADTYNQAIMGVGIASESGDSKICYRYRDGYVSVPGAFGNHAYDAALVVGTQYKVYCAERIE